MDKSQFEELKKKVARRKTIYSLKAKIEDYEFKIIEYTLTIETLRKEKQKAVESLENLEKLETV